MEELVAWMAAASSQQDLAFPCLAQLQDFDANNALEVVWGTAENPYSSRAYREDSDLEEEEKEEKEKTQKKIDNISEDLQRFKDSLAVGSFEEMFGGFRGCRPGARCRGCCNAADKFEKETAVATMMEGLTGANKNLTKNGIYSK